MAGPAVNVLTKTIFCILQANKMKQFQQQGDLSSTATAVTGGDITYIYVKKLSAPVLYLQAERH